MDSRVLFGWLSKQANWDAKLTNLTDNRVYSAHISAKLVILDCDFSTTHGIHVEP